MIEALFGIRIVGIVRRTRHPHPIIPVKLRGAVKAISHWHGVG
jgi:hypothetical protein